MGPHYNTEQERYTDREFLAWRALDGRVVGGGCTLRLAMYENRKPALEAVAGDGSPECMLTVNLEEECLGEGEFHVRFEVKRWSEVLFEALVSEGIAAPTGKIVGAGHVERYAEVWCLRLDAS